VAARALTSLNLTLDDIRAQVESIVGTYHEEGTGGQAPFSARSKKVLELALREALQLRHSYVGSEHILLGLVREPESLASQILLTLGVESSSAMKAEAKRPRPGWRRRRSKGWT
jgi:ATP-dependent Clp protease ATP-binding subunit ClpC